MYRLAQVLLTVAALGYSLIPVVADFNRTHATNPTWDPHARFHIVWQVSSYIGVAAIALCMTWFGSADRYKLLLVSGLAMCMYGGFFSAVFTMRWYGGTLYSKDGILPVPLRLGARQISADVNLTVFTGIVAIVIVPAVILLAWIG